jgi:hypothetical protein
VPCETGSPLPGASLPALARGRELRADARRDDRGRRALRVRAAFLRCAAGGTQKAPPRHPRPLATRDGSPRADARLGMLEEAALRAAAVCSSRSRRSRWRTREPVSGLSPVSIPVSRDTPTRIWLRGSAAPPRYLSPARERVAASGGRVRGMRTARSGEPSARRLPAGSRKPARDSAVRRLSRDAGGGGAARRVDVFARCRWRNSVVVKGADCGPEIVRRVSSTRFPKRGSGRRCAAASRGDGRPHNRRRRRTAVSRRDRPSRSFRPSAGRPGGR